MAGSASRSKSPSRKAASSGGGGQVSPKLATTAIGAWWMFIGMLGLVLPEKLLAMYEVPLDALKAEGTGYTLVTLTMQFWMAWMMMGVGMLSITRREGDTRTTGLICLSSAIGMTLFLATMELHSGGNGVAATAGTDSAASVATCTETAASSSVSEDAAACAAVSALAYDTACTAVFTKASTTDDADNDITDVAACTYAEATETAEGTAGTAGTGWLGLGMPMKAVYTNYVVFGGLVGLNVMGWIDAGKPEPDLSLLSAPGNWAEKYTVAICLGFGLAMLFAQDQLFVAYKFTQDGSATKDFTKCVFTGLGMTLVWHAVALVCTLGGSCAASINRWLWAFFTMMFGIQCVMTTMTTHILVPTMDVEMQYLNTALWLAGALLAWKKMVGL